MSEQIRALIIAAAALVGGLIVLAVLSAAFMVPMMAWHMPGWGGAWGLFWLWALQWIGLVVVGVWLVVEVTRPRRTGGGS